MLLGAQTYTVRDYTQSVRDFEESMRRIAAIGYRSVQLSGIGNISPAVCREICDSFGLSIVLTHTNADRILNDVDAVIRDHEILGCDYIGIGMMPKRYQTPEWVDRFCMDYLRSAEAIHAAGKLLMYHNHNLEWTRLPDGRRIMDVLLAQMPPELMGFTLDTYWVQAAGADVLDWISRLHGRIPCVHLKDMAVQGFEIRMSAVGEGNMDFSRILAALEKDGGCRHILVEQDTCYGADPFDCLRRSYENIRKLGYGA